MKPDTIVVVSGLPRSGTSMMMKMLDAGGLKLLVDNIRVGDEDNPLGYYEFEPVKQLQRDPSWLAEARGKGVKIVSALLKHLPPQYRYQVIFMQRNMTEVLASQKQMLIRRGERTDEVPDEKLAEIFAQHLRQVDAWLSSQPQVEVLYVRYDDALNAPLDVARQVQSFLGRDLDVENMARVVDRTLHRQRA